jgi:hypothetical protein
VAFHEGHGACLVKAYIETVLTKDGAMMIGTREVVHTGYPDVVKNVSTGLLAEMSKGLAGIQTPTRRRETRIVEQKICEYELCESIDEEAVVIQQGETYSLNRSQHGILLFMGCAPRIEQLLELRIPESRWRRSLNLFEVQWTKPVRVESCGHLFLVGCRLVFGPSRYWAF